MPLVNDTYKAGVENLVYNAVLKRISANRGVSLVSRWEDADAILKGTVNQASFGTSGSTPANQLFGNSVLPPDRRGSANIAVATVFSAEMMCTFSLERAVAPPAKGETVWSGSFSDKRSFPANNQIDVFGTSSALINESEFDRSLRDLADTLSRDLYESLFVLF